jgi:AGCS family alanine or glycine:cation symporter
LEFAWEVADTLNGLMALPNLIGLLMLSGVTFALTKKYFSTGSSL